MTENWPLVLTDGELRLRPLRRRDRRAHAELRARNRAWLLPWDGTEPGAGPSSPRPQFGQMLRSFERGARAGTMLPLAIEVDGRLAGQVTAAPIIYGPSSGAVIGYWIDRARAGRGYTPRAVALLVDHLFRERGVHRIELAIRPENTASLAVARKLGLRDEGLRLSCVHVDGSWRDHRIFALVADEVHDGLLNRLRDSSMNGG